MDMDPEMDMDIHRLTSYIGEKFIPTSDIMPNSILIGPILDLPIWGSVHYLLFTDIRLSARLVQSAKPEKDGLYCM